MENVKTFFESFKEFIWDIIGYLLPGALVVFILSSIVLDKYFLPSPLITNDNGMLMPAFLILSYLVGYLVYSLGVTKENFRGGKAFTKRVEDKVSKKNSYVIAKEIIEKELASKSIGANLSTSTVRDIRSIAMGYAPEADQKVYTFMFRSDICNQVGNISLLLGILGLLFCFFDILNIEFLSKLILFKTDTNFVVFYFILIPCHLILKAARDRFYSMAMTLPLSILISKTLNK